MRRKNKHETMGWVAGFILFLSLVGIGRVAWADWQDILLKFQPYIWVEETYTNNADLTQKNTKSDFITTVYPGIRFSTMSRSAVTGEQKSQPPLAGELGWRPPSEEEKVGLEFDYRPGFVFYLKETDNNYISQNGTLNAWYTVASKLTFRLSEYLIRSEEPLEPAYPGYTPTYISGSFVDLTSLNLPGSQRKRFIYLRNVVTPSVEYAYAKDSLVSVLYRNNIYQTEDPAGEDSQENFINPRLTHWFDIRNGILLDYGLTFGTYQRSPDLTGNAIRGRYTYRFNPKTSIFGEYIFLLRNFDSPGVDYQVQAPSIGLVHAFSPALSLSVQAGYFWQNPEKGSGNNAPTYVVLLTQRDARTTYSLLAQGGYRENFFATGDTSQGFMLYHSAVGAVTHQFTEKITGTVSGSYEYDKSGLVQMSGPITSVNRRDQIWVASGGLRYQWFRWLNLSINLSYTGDNSNIDTSDYTEFRAMFRVEATYKK
jgi:hypothetical protein